MKKLAIGLLIPSSLVLIGMGLAQQNFDDVQIATTHVAGPVYMFEGSEGNIGVSAGQDGILIVDDQYAPLAAKILAALQKLDKGELQFILNTHYHGDHTGGNEILGQSAPIIAHTNTRTRLLDQPKAAWPIITFDDDASVHFNGEEIKAVHYPRGHTDGDLVIFFTESNVVHIGDHFFVDRFPYVDIDAGGNALGMMSNVERLLAIIPSDAKIIPGHGPLATLDDLREFHGMLTETIGMVRQKRAAGQSLEQIQREGVPEEYDTWGGGFIDTETWLESVYRSISDE